MSRAKSTIAMGKANKEDGSLSIENPLIPIIIERKLTYLVWIAS